MKRAYVDIRDTPHYRKEAFVAGLKAHGFHVELRLPSAAPAPHDVMLIWNRYSDRELTANKWEAEGGRVLVAENGYVGRDAQGRQLYALARHGHNGSGTWPQGGGERWAALGVEIKPWRSSGEHVLVAPNRHFGMRGLAMPQGWQQEATQALRAHTRRPVRIRPHPNDSAPARPLVEDLANCWAVVIWASSVGVHALLAGVPVIALSPWWICKAAAYTRLDGVENPPLAERLPALERLAWAQWTVEEIGSGYAFGHLLSDAGQEQVEAAA